MCLSCLSCSSPPLVYKSRMRWGRGWVSYCKLRPSPQPPPPELTGVGILGGVDCRSRSMNRCRQDSMRSIPEGWPWLAQGAATLLRRLPAPLCLPRRQTLGPSTQHRIDTLASDIVSTTGMMDVYQMPNIPPTNVNDGIECAQTTVGNHRRMTQGLATPKP